MTLLVLAFILAVYLPLTAWIVVNTVDDEESAS